MRHFASFTAAAVLAFAATAAQAATQPTTAADFNLFVIGNQLTHGSDVQGAVAIGGNSHFDSFSVGDQLSGYGGLYTFVVGGNLDLGDGGITGKTIVGGAYTGPGYHDVTIAGATPLPVDFDAEATRLYGLTDYLAGYATTGTATIENGGQRFILDALDTGLNVINIDAADLAGSNEFIMHLGANSKLLINVFGSSSDISGGMSIAGGGNDDVLWNFSEATSLSMHNIGMLGSVLAPNAQVNANGVIWGQLIAGGFGQYAGDTMQVNLVKFGGDLLTLTPPPSGAPEPAAWALMLGGFGLLGAALRRRRALALA